MAVQVSHSELSQLNVVIEKEVEAAKLAIQQGNKQKALLALKKKKYQVQLLEKTDQQLMNLEELVRSDYNVKRFHANYKFQTHSIEYALVEKQILEGLKHGNDVLNEIHKETSVEAVEKLMDDTADAIAYQNVGAKRSFDAVYSRCTIGNR